jgi:hypothetical protein
MQVLQNINVETAEGCRVMVKKGHDTFRECFPKARANFVDGSLAFSRLLMRGRAGGNYKSQV